MKFSTIIVTTLSILAIPVQTSAQESFYIGIGGSYSYATSDPQVFSTPSSDQFSSVGLTLGFRVEQESYFWAGELDVNADSGSTFVGASGTPCPPFADGPYYCQVDSTARLKGIVGTEIGTDFEFFGSLGLVKITGQSATGPFSQAANSNSGYTFGIGIQKKLKKGRVRLELIRDIANNSIIDPFGNNPNYSATSAKMSFVVDFN
jgi:hypothetical protein